MRATKGYVAGVGTTSALVGAIGCAFAVLSTVVAVHGWPLTLSGPSTPTVEGRSAAVEDAGARLGAFLEAPRGAAHSRARVSRVAKTERAGVAPASAGPVASAFGPTTAHGVPVTRGPRGRSPSGGPAAGAASPSPGSAAGARPVPAAGAGSGSGTTATPPPPADSSTTLGGAVTEVTGGAGTAVAQTGQQLAGAVQGATSQLGGTVGQLSPAAGQAVAQTGQVAGGVVSGATGAAGQVVSGAGATVGGLLGGLAGGR